MTAPQPPRMAGVPAFSRPPQLDQAPPPMSSPQDSPPPETSPTPSPRSALDALARPFASPFRKGEPTLTGTSSAAGPKRDVGNMTTETATAAAVAVLGVALMGAAFLVRLRTKAERKLRQPTTDERDAIAAPAAQLLLRRLPGGWSRDLLDGLAVLAGVGTYVNAGPLTTPTSNPGALAPADSQES